MCPAGLWLELPDPGRCSRREWWQLVKPERPCPDGPTVCRFLSHLHLSAGVPFRLAGGNGIRSGWFGGYWCCSGSEDFQPGPHGSRHLFGWGQFVATGAGSRGRRSPSPLASLVAVLLVFSGSSLFLIVPGVVRRSASDQTLGVLSLLRYGGSSPSVMCLPGPSPPFRLLPSSSVSFLFHISSFFLSGHF